MLQLLKKEIIMTKIIFELFANAMAILNVIVSDFILVAKN